MLDLTTKLKETDEAIALLRTRGIRVPEEAAEIQEILRRCIAAELQCGAVDDTGQGIGQQAYEAYARHTQWKSLATGADLPQWAVLSDEIRAAWNVSAAWVAGVVLRRVGLQ